MLPKLSLGLISNLFCALHFPPTPASSAILNSRTDVIPHTKSICSPNPQWLHVIDSSKRRWTYGVNPAKMKHWVAEPVALSVASRLLPFTAPYPGVIKACLCRLMSTGYIPQIPHSSTHHHSHPLPSDSHSTFTYHIANALTCWDNISWWMCIMMGLFITHVHIYLGLILNCWFSYLGCREGVSLNRIWVRLLYDFCVINSCVNTKSHGSNTRAI